MWGVDTGVKDTTVNIDTDPDDQTSGTDLPDFLTEEAQWIELYNTTNENITADLYLLFTPFISHPERDVVHLNGTSYTVLDAVSTLFFGKWELPGKSGRRPNTAFVSAYRDIDYDVVEDTNRTRAAQLTGIPFGSYEESWQETPEEGRRNTELKILDEKKIVVLPYIATPGTKHVPEVFIRSLRSSPVNANSVVINEVRNDTSRANIDWIELKNVSSRSVDLEDWELSIVTLVGEDGDLVDLPPYIIQKGEILLILNQHPHLTDLAEGINIEDPEAYLVRRGLTHKYFIDENLDLPANQTFTLLLRSENDQNGKDVAIADYAGNGFFTDDLTLTTEFWPRLAQPRPTDVADFGASTFASGTQAWARTRYEKDDGHHKEAWEVIEAQGGIGYAANADHRYAPGTPGYENDALKTRLKNKILPSSDTEYDDGDISISEIMYDPGPDRNRIQWIELYNSSKTQAVNLKGWELEIHNLEYETGAYVDGTFSFEDAVILPNQTLLLVSEFGANNVPSNRVYDLYRFHRRDLGLTRWPRLLLNPTAFYLKLTDTANSGLRSDDTVVDEVGNLKVEHATRTKEWDLPKVATDRRRSMVRRYGSLFKPEQDGLDGKPSPPGKGLTAEGWRRVTVQNPSFSFYGIRSDLASPGHRLGTPLPVVLASFRPKRIETGQVLIHWRTASELNNAGFNILRSETRDGDFILINLKGLIPGHGTSSEMHTYSHTDTTAKPNTIYYYRIEDVALDGTRQTLATVRLKGDISAANKLITNWSKLKSEK